MSEGSCTGVTTDAIPEFIYGNWQAVVFKLNQMYQHKIMQVNYVTYNIRHREDVIHTGTSHCHVMFYNPLSLENSLEHPFWQ
jgi:hypothetical protein